MRWVRQDSEGSRARRERWVTRSWGMTGWREMWGKQGSRVTRGKMAKHSLYLLITFENKLKNKTLINYEQPLKKIKKI